MAQNKPTYEAQGGFRQGSIKIADDVVANIAAIAATEVDGVEAMAGNITREFLDAVGVRNQKKGVRVLVHNKQIKIDLAIVMDYGYNVPTTCQQVQNRVKNAVENMTGLKVVDVNIRIAGINVAK